MSKVFRLYNIQGDNNITDWGGSKVYGSTAIGQITDPDGADAKKEITSIPSPFARIDLIKTAFKRVVRMANLDMKSKEYQPFNGRTIYHKMVSDSLDVAEIFFNFDRYRDKFQIIIWDKKRDLKNDIFCRTLKRYLDSDSQGSDPYNFSKFDRMYMLNYIGPGRPSNLNIVGATSPATLFFSSADDLSYVSNNISIGADRPFDNSYKPLFERDFEFQKYLYSFRKAYGRDFNEDFEEVDKYLESNTGQVSNYKFLNEVQKNDVSALSESSINNYEPIYVGEKGADTLDVLGRPFHKKSSVIDWKSDFEIKSTLFEGKKPLVLPVDSGNAYSNLKYTIDPWGTENKAPFSESKVWSERTLPIVGDKYPYLTISDFLTDTIVRMPYPLNDESFFSGSYKSKEDSYLLPLKDTFFRFFSVNELQENVDGNKKMFEFEPNPSGVKAILRIPIVGNKNVKFVEYSRIYFGIAQPDVINNDGNILDKKIGMGILPLVTFPENVKKHYRIALFEKGANDVNLVCYSGNTIVTNDAHVKREEKNYEYNECSKEAYILTNNFDRINVKVGDTTGVIIPKFKKINGNRIYTFAIDFGTTNSHIEYGYVTNPSEKVSVANSFDIQSNEKQIHRLHKLYPDRDINGAFEHNFIPDIIAVDEKNDYQFPMRTVFSVWNQIDRSQVNHALAHGNIPFLYEKETVPGYNETRTELKWLGEEEYPLVKLYLENIFLLLRNKVILNGGNLQATKIIWFYPASMDTGRRDDFNAIWMDLYKEYFGSYPYDNLISISESTAPYSYYHSKQGARSEVVTIDIGGGTTDVFVVDNNKPSLLLSFLYASNAVFGDAYSWDSDNNGFVNLYVDKFTETLQKNDLGDLVSTLKQIERHKNSTDIIAFLFSLVANKKVGKNEELNFLFKLSQNKKLKYVFIVFYGSILYFIAKSMKNKGLKQPLTLAFSGNGSKTLRILSPSNNTIGEFAKLIFEKVYGEKGNKLDIIFEEEPKKATCKGGIFNPTQQTPNDIKPIKFNLIGNDLDLNVDVTEKFKFEQITEEVQEQIVNSVIEYINSLFEIQDHNDEFLTHSLGADESVIEIVKEICNDRVELSQSLKSALSMKKPSKVIEETLFFYPLVGVLHELALKISKL